MTNIFSATEFRSFLEEHFKNSPKKGHGLRLKIAEHLRVHPTLITQVMKGQKTFTLEQGLSLAEMIGMSDLEKDYFLALIELDRAGTQSLKNFISRKLLKLREESSKVKNRVQAYSQLSEADQALFYSQWYYSAMRLFASTAEQVTFEDYRKNFDLPEDRIELALEFLTSRGLIEKKNEFYKMAVANTFIPADSPLVVRHHANWRLKALEHHPKLSAEELAFTAPISLSQKDFAAAKSVLLEAIQKISKIVKDSEPEQVACLNLDLFRVSNPN